MCSNFISCCWWKSKVVQPFWKTDSCFCFCFFFFFFFFFFFNGCLFLRNRETEHERGRDRGRPRAASRLQLSAQSPTRGSNLGTREIMTWVQVRGPTDWLTQAPRKRIASNKVKYTNTLWPSNSIPRFIPTQNERTSAQKDSCKNIHGSLIHIMQNWK